LCLVRTTTSRKATSSKGPAELPGTCGRGPDRQGC
jgi:hypothetical protein